MHAPPVVLEQRIADRLRSPGQTSFIAASPDEARNTWNNYVPWYEVTLAAYRADVTELAELCNIQTGAAILELGCGSGWFLEAASEKLGKSGRLMGIDINRELLRQADARMASFRSRNPLSVAAELIEGDMAGLSEIQQVQRVDGFGGFDLIVCQ